MKARLRKLLWLVRKEGVITAGRELLAFSRRTLAEVVAGAPGYYQLQRWQIARRYEYPSAIQPVWVDFDRIVGLSGGYEHFCEDRQEFLPKFGHLDYLPQFRPRESKISLPSEATVPYGTVRGGDWDCERAPLSELLLYQGTRARLCDGVEWSETEYHQQLIKMFQDQGHPHAEARTLADNRCARIDVLADRIRETGYQSQRQLGGHPLNEVTVNVSREGDLLYNSEGRHRLCVAAALGVERIPVLVLVRHTDYTGGLSS